MDPKPRTPRAFRRNAPRPSPPAAATRLVPRATGENAVMAESRAEIQPELWVRDGPAAVAFYERAFGAVVEHRVNGPGERDVVAQLAVAGARFWVSNAGADLRRLSPDAIGGATARMLLVVDDPE